MAISLAESWAKHAKKAGADTFEMAAGKTLKIETSPAGVAILNATVPSGKKWVVTVVVDLKEEDV